jgi:nucleoside-diphosphate-sugar epimerase
MSSKLVLVTGGGGYLALHVINQFVKEGFRVRTTVRNLDDKEKLASIQKAAKDAKTPIEFVAADLLKPETWPAAVEGCDIVAHVASPFPSSAPAHEDDLIKPAVEGTLNVLRAAFDAGVKRVVVTSSTAAVNTGAKNYIFTEKDWADPVECLRSYQKSKVLAEKCAWEYWSEKKKTNQPCFGLAVINPSFILGPTLQSGLSTIGTSEEILIGILGGKSETIRPYFASHCDVRDVALAHVRASTLPEAVGNRHIIASLPRSLNMKEATEILREEYASKGYSNIPTKLDQVEDPKTVFDNSRMVNILGITPIDYKKTILDMAESLINAGLVKKA